MSERDTPVYCKDCFVVHKQLVEMTEDEESPLGCPHCDSKRKLNLNEARRIIDLSLNHYKRLMCELEIIDD